MATPYGQYPNTIQYGNYTITPDWKVIQTNVGGLSRYIYLNPNDPTQNFVSQGRSAGIEEFLSQNGQNYEARAEDYPQLLTPTGTLGRYELGQLANDPSSQVINGERVAIQDTSSPLPGSIETTFDRTISGGAGGAGGIAGSGSGSSGSSGGFSLGIDISGLPPEFQEIYTQLEGYLGELQKRGQVINPNVQITPDKIAQFISQAEKEINPYYANRLKVAKEGFLREVGYTAEEITRQEKLDEQTYQRNLQGLGEQSAESGFAQSGRRIQDEQDLAQGTQEAIDARRRSAAFQLGSQARQFAQQFGGAQTPNFNIPDAPGVFAGENKFAQSGRTLPFYQLSPEVYDGLVGEDEFQRRAQVAGRTSELEEALRTTQGIDQARRLTL